MKKHCNNLLNRSTTLATAVFIITAIQLTTTPAKGGDPYWPDTIQIPVGFQAEGIERGKGSEFFLGGFSFSSFFSPALDIVPPHPLSPYAGAIYKGDLRTGMGEILVAPTGKPVSGLSYDPRTDYLYAATGYSDGYLTGLHWDQGVVVYDASSGELIEEIIFDDGLLINDVLVTQSAVYCTDSVNAVLYKVVLGPNGQLPSPPVVKAIEMPEFAMVYVYDDDTGALLDADINANGLVGSFDGKKLVIINIATGILYLVDTESGAATPIDVQGDEQLFVDGDGLYLEGNTLYIIQNFQNKIAVVRLSGDLTKGVFVKNLPSGGEANPLNVATSLTGLGDSLYAINTHALEVFFGDPDLVQVEVVKLSK